MSSNRLVTLVAAMMLLSVAAPAFAGSAVATDGSLSVGVTQNDDGSATVTVTHNNSSVDNATVSVTAANASYDGEGTYTTDSAGTVSLPAPNETATIDVTAEWTNASASTTATLDAVNTSTNNTTSNNTTSNNTTATNNTTNFGLQVTEFIQQFKSSNNSTGALGPALANFVVANNPGNAPEHAGPPMDLTRGPPENKTRGPPENKTRGPPEDKGPNKGGSGGSSTSGGNGGNGGGPPEHAGPKN